MVKRIGVLTGGGDVPGLNTIIRDIVLRADKENIEVYGLKRGWGSLVFMDPEKKWKNPEHVIKLTFSEVRKIDRDGGTFLHTSRVNPPKMKKNPDLLKYRGFQFEHKTDMTPDVLKNLENLGLDYLVAIGGNDTLSYAYHLDKLGVPIIGIPKTMDGDVKGTDYCIGFSSAISTGSKIVTDLRTTLGSHERFGIIECFGRYSGFTALYIALAAKPDCVIIPEVAFNIDHLLELLQEDRSNNPSNYSIVLIAEGAKIQGSDGMVIQDKTLDAYGNPKLGGIGETVSNYIKKKTGRETLSENLRYILRSGDPDAKDKIYASIFGNAAFNAIMRGEKGVMTAVVDGKTVTVPLSVVGHDKNEEHNVRTVEVEKFYNKDRYRPIFENLEGNCLIL